MIKGVGVDLVSIARMRRIVIKWDKKFLNRFFTEREISYIYKNSMSYETISGIFASKEATSKVLGTGFREIRLKDIEVLHDNLGKPYIKLHGKARDLSENLGIEDMEVSISHERDYVISFVIGYGERPLVIDSRFRSLLPKRNLNTHKGSYGRLGVVAGSKGMVGANYLATMAGLRTGAGLVYSIIPESLLDIMSIKLVEAIIVPLKDRGGFFSLESIGCLGSSLEEYDSLVVGPGLGVGEGMLEFMKFIMNNYEGTLLIDADGLNIVSKKLELFNEREGQTVITPHPGEFARLLGVDIREVEEKRLKYAIEFSKKHKLITVLKGSETIVTDGNQVYINDTGNPGMATAGSGDVLSGIIGGLLSQGVEAFNSARLGVYLHGLAGDLAGMERGEYGLIARDIIDSIPQAINLISNP